MANRFWVGGNANWDATAGTKWATTSGGAGGAAVPTAADDVFLDNGAGTGNVTIPSATTVTCRSLNCTGYVNTLTFAATTSVITVGDGTAGASNIAVKFVSGMTLTLTAVGTINFASTSATQQTIDTGTKTMPNMTFQGVGSSYLLNDAVTTGTTATLTLTSGIVNTNALTHTFGIINISGSLARTWNMTNSTINIIGGAATVWNAGTTTNLTFTTTGSTLTFTGSGSTLASLGMSWGGLSYATVNITAPSLCTFAGASTFSNLTLTASANTVNEIRLNNNVTYTNATFNGNSVANRLIIRSNTVGTQRTITSANTPTTNGFVDLMDIIKAGASANWSDTGWGVQNCTNITGATPGTSYWVGGAGSYTDATNHWASSSGGTAGTGRAPLLQDTGYFDANSGSGTLTFNAHRYGSLDFSNTALTAVSLVGGFTSVFFAGDLILSASAPLTITGFADVISFTGRGSHTLTSPGTTWAVSSPAINTTGTYTLGSSYTATSGFTVTLGTFDASIYDLTITTLTWASGATVNCGTGNNWNVTSDSGTVCSVNAGATVNAQTSRINLQSVSASAKTFGTGGKSFPDIVISAGGAGAWTFNATATYNSISMTGTGTKSIIFTAGTTATILNNNWLRGRSGNLITITSSSAGSAFTLAYTGTITTDYISLKDCTASGTTPFYAGANSTDVSGNTNWLFVAAPGGSGNFLLMGVG
jgi:hypothetical protein